MNTSNLRRSEQGLTLVELLLVLVVVLAIAVVGFITFGQTSANQRTQATQQALLSVSSGIKSIANGPNYTGVTETVLVNAGKAPANLINAAGTGINNPFGGAITVLAKNINSGTANAYMVCMTAVPRNECNSLVASTASSFPMVAAGSAACPAGAALPTAGIVKNAYAATPVVPTASSIATACNREANTIVWIGG